MKRTLLLGLSLALGAAAAYAAPPVTTPPVTPPATGQPAPIAPSQRPAAEQGAPKDVEKTANYLGQLHQINVNQIALNQLAAKQGQTAEVRDYANSVVKAYTTADTNLMDVVKKTGINLTASKDMQSENDRAVKRMNELQKETPAKFDKSFAKYQEEDQSKALDLVNSARKEVSDPQVKAYLDGVVPQYEGFLKDARRLTGRMGT
jgi:predicted outer membrane protein